MSDRTSRGKSELDEDRPTILSFPGLHQHPAVAFHALQEWEGYVTEINDTGFTANLIDLTAGDSFEQEEADIPLDEVSEGDAAKIKVGSIFRWMIGYERSESGTKKRVSHIVFRDSPVVTETDLRAGEKWARNIVEAFTP